MPNQTPVAHRYYPKLSSVVTPDQIPDILGFIKDGVIGLLDKIYYKDLQYSKGPKGDSAFYSLSLVSKRLDIEIPGTGISLVLNPDMTGNQYIGVMSDGRTAVICIVGGENGIYQDYTNILKTSWPVI